MKKLAMLLVGLILFIGTVANSNATPMYYTFEGSVTWLWGDVAGFELFDTVSYKLLVDFDLQGKETYNGVESIHGDDYFYTEYVSGSAMARPESISTTLSYNYGTKNSTTSSVNDFNQNYFSTYSHAFLDVKNWTIGTLVQGFDGINVIGGGSGSGQVTSSLTITDISPVETPPSSVPEPSTLLLLGSGLLGLVGLNRRRKA